MVVASKQTSSSVVGKTECRQFFNDSSKQAFNNFENVIEYAQSIRIIQFNDTEWKLSTCNCVEWKKLFKCNHVIAVAYLNKKLDWDVRAIESNRKKGRPPQAKSALSKQQIATLTQQVFSNVANSLPIESQPCTSAVAALRTLPVISQSAESQLPEPVPLASSEPKNKKKRLAKENVNLNENENENVPPKRILRPKKVKS